MEIRRNYVAVLYMVSYKLTGRPDEGKEIEEREAVVTPLNSFNSSRVYTIVKLYQSIR
jgi:hypothetical protein